VDRRQRVQVVIKGGCQSACIAGANVPAGTLALVRSLLVLRCSREQNALHTLIYQRPSHAILQRHAPTAERTLDLARPRPVPAGPSETSHRVPNSLPWRA
jgi:hypothetical protein